MPCDQDRAALAAYLDGELPPDQAAAVEQHLAGCAGCAAEVAAQLSLKRSLRAARGQFTPSAAFRQKVRRQIAGRQRRGWLGGLIPVLATAAALAIVSVLWLQSSQRAGTFAEAADLHISALASSNPVDVVSTDRHTVKPWFQGRIPFAFNIPEPSGTEFALLGGRLVYLHQQPGAQLLFTRGAHKISVLIFQGTPRMAALPTGESKRNSFSVETWSAEGLRFLVIGDTDPAEIHKLAEAIRAVNQ